jgi:hypothetical protein
MAGAKVVCEQLAAEQCAFAVSSTSRRCVLENTHCAGRPTAYQCRTSEVVVEDGRLAGMVETDRATVARRHLLRLPPRSARRRRSLLAGLPPGVPQAPNIVNFYANLVAGEGKHSTLTSLQL